MKRVTWRIGEWIVGLAVVCLAAEVYGAITWTGGDGSWSDDLNWSAGEPSASDTVYINNGGTARCEAGEVCGYLILGNGAGESGTVRLDDAADSLTNTTTVATLGLFGTGTVVHANGLFYSPVGMRLGYYATGYGKYVLSNGTALLYGDVNVGASVGLGEVFQSGGVLDLRSAGVNNGRFTVRNGLYELTGGTMGARYSFTLGATDDQTGRFVVNGPTALLAPTNSALANGVPFTLGSGGEGILEVTQGAVYTDGGWIVGSTDTGRVTQTGGTVTLSNGKGVAIGNGATATGTYELYGGTLSIDKAPWPERGLIAGGSGTGTFKMGNASGCGVLTQAVAGVGMIVGWNAGSAGTLRGWSDDGSGNKFLLTGPFYMNSGQVIADGYGTDRALDIAGLDFKGNSIGNPIDGSQGWFAQNHGELRLNTIKHFAIPKVCYWGESVGDTVPDMINSAYMPFSDNQTVVTGRLYAVDHGSVNALGSLTAISVHEFTGASMGTCDLTIRYDHIAASNAGLAEADLKLYQWNGSAWADVTSSLDTGTRLVTASNLVSLGQFAIGQPSGKKAGTLFVIR